MTLEEVIFDEAGKLGFAAIGIAGVAPAESFEIFGNWLEAGNAAGMDFLKRNPALRADIRHVMPEVKSVITVAARYPVNMAPGHGFSTCFRGVDYHMAIRKKLFQLADCINTITAVSTRICVDSAPVIEREWAIRSGIGWRGKQGQIVNPNHGCCLLIGELMISRELQSTAPLQNQCGSCRLCIDACPTKALAEDGMIDCRKCLSYMTIEHKDDIPETLHGPMGQTLFGCDICTAICPWNKLRRDNIMPDFRERPMPDAEEIMAMTDVEFKLRFKDTNVYRTGLIRLQRNAVIVLRNRPNHSAM